MDPECVQMYKITLRRVHTTIVGKTIGMVYSEHISVALGIEHAMRMGHIVMWPVRYTIFFHVIS